MYEEHFKWFVALVCRRFGPNAEEYAGVAFMDVVKAYDPAKGAFRAFANAAVDFVVKNHFSKDNGRIRSAKRQGLSSQTMIYEDSAEATEERGDFLDVLRQLDSIDVKSDRVIGICRVLGLFDQEDTAFILNRRSIRGAFS